MVDMSYKAFVWDTKNSLDSRHEKLKTIKNTKLLRQLEVQLVYLRKT